MITGIGEYSVIQDGQLTSVCPAYFELTPKLKTKPKLAREYSRGTVYCKTNNVTQLNWELRLRDEDADFESMALLWSAQLTDTINPLNLCSVYQFRGLVYENGEPLYILIIEQMYKTNGGNLGSFDYQFEAIDPQIFTVEGIIIEDEILMTEDEQNIQTEDGQFITLNNVIYLLTESSEQLQAEDGQLIQI